MMWYKVFEILLINILTFFISLTPNHGRITKNKLIKKVWILFEMI